MKEFTRREIKIFGVVQGVGFRPFIYNLAKRHNINGYIKNNGSHVLIDIESFQNIIDDFIYDINNELPPLAYIEKMEITEYEFLGYTNFEILNSDEKNDDWIYISPDVSICNDCLIDMNDISNRRYNYPFTNCTNCGPRFTITNNIPYDRENTVMDKFIMCEDCKQEYNNPTDRRFHAQPISCNNCGPTVKLLNSDGEQIIEKDIFKKVRMLIKDNKILAVKGLGGFHLVCNGVSETALKLMRERKRRDAKPFALMAKDVEVVKKYCKLNDKEENILISNKRPIVLLEKLHHANVPDEISIDNDMLGIMLPYTPFHYMLFQDDLEILVMTSGNIAGEPIYYTNEEALSGLQGVADYFLLHDRDIYIRTDDSVTSVFQESEYIIRRSRGYVPFPIKLPAIDESKNIKFVLACGGELKNAYCITKNNLAFLSHHIGDLENYETLNSFEDGIDHFKKVLKVEPDIIACDLHPEYLSTKYAQSKSKYDVKYIQHHHAHIASCMVENNISKKVIGVVFDGTGYGEDGNIWGGEFFVGDFSGFKREAHFKYVPMPGGELAIKEPWRMALAFLSEINEIDLLNEIQQDRLELVYQQIIKKVNCPMTSSVGRLFDGVSSILGLCNKIDYEGQAAILLEKVSNKNPTQFYQLNIDRQEINNIIQINTIDLIRFIKYDLAKGLSVSEIGGKFHLTLAKIIKMICNILKSKYLIDDVVLSGGVFQNRLLLTMTKNQLEEDGFKVHIHSKVPTNDGGISLGQAIMALHHEIN